MDLMHGVSTVCVKYSCLHQTLRAENHLMQSTFLSDDECGGCDSAAARQQAMSVQHPNAPTESVNKVRRDVTSVQQ